MKALLRVLVPAALVVPAGLELNYCINAAVLIASVAFSRMYLGVHYFSDVLSAAAASGAWLAPCLSAVHAWFDSRRP